jgi:hypothetical protein
MSQLIDLASKLLDEDFNNLPVMHVAILPLEKVGN